MEYNRSESFIFPDHRPIELINRTVDDEWNQTKFL